MLAMVMVLAVVILAALVAALTVVVLQRYQFLSCASFLAVWLTMPIHTVTRHAISDLNPSGSALLTQYATSGLEVIYNSVMYRSSIQL